MVPLIRQGWSVHFETMVIKISVIMPESGLGNGASLPSQWFLKTGKKLEIKTDWLTLLLISKSFAFFNHFYFIVS